MSTSIPVIDDQAKVQRFRQSLRVYKPKTSAIPIVVRATDHWWVAMLTPAIASRTTV
jgi:hypothetical protein